MNRCFFIFFLLLFEFALAQIDPNTLMGIPILTTAERTGITAPITEGNMVYDSDINRLFEYTDTGWQEILTAGSVTYPGVVQITGEGIITVTGLPFRPSSVSFVAHANVEDFNLNTDNGSVRNDRGIRNTFGTANGFARNDSGTVVQQCIYVSGHGNSINGISRFASNTNCLGVRYGDQNGLFLGSITASLTAFTANGFTLNVVYTNGNVTTTNVNPNVLPQDIDNEGLVVLFTAYR